MYQIPIFQIQPEPNLVGFMNSNQAGPGARFENQLAGFVKKGRTPELLEPKSGTSVAKSNLIFSEK